MTNTPDTSPEAVERTCQELLDTCKGQPAQISWPHRPQHKAVATLRALSAAHAAALVRERDANAKAMQHLRRAEAAEAALKEERASNKIVLEYVRAVVSGIGDSLHAVDASIRDMKRDKS